MPNENALSAKDGIAARDTLRIISNGNNARIRVSDVAKYFVESYQRSYGNVENATLQAALTGMYDHIAVDISNFIGESIDFFPAFWNWLDTVIAQRIVPIDADGNIHISGNYYLQNGMLFETTRRSMGAGMMFYGEEAHETGPSISLNKIGLWYVTINAILGTHVIPIECFSLEGVLPYVSINIPKPIGTTDDIQEKKVNIPWPSVITGPTDMSINACDVVEVTELPFAFTLRPKILVDESVASYVSELSVSYRGDIDAVYLG